MRPPGSSGCRHLTSVCGLHLSEISELPRLLCSVTKPQTACKRLAWEALVRRCGEYLRRSPVPKTEVKKSPARYTTRQRETRKATEERKGREAAQANSRERSRPEAQTPRPTAGNRKEHQFSLQKKCCCCCCCLSGRKT